MSSYNDIERMKFNPVEQISIQKVNVQNIVDAKDKVVIEEPLQIELEYSTATGRLRKEIAVTMRTPGNDDELSAGFLFTEGIINELSIREIKQTEENRVLVILRENYLPALNNSSRNFYTTSSCGICGKASIESIRTNSVFENLNDDMLISTDIIYQLQKNIEKNQLIFNETGGIHASVLFDLKGKIITLKEDVGRHNALDKVIGALLMCGSLPLNNHILFLSGRAGFELVQKATMAGIRFIAAVGAPSSLAVELAKESGITLIGFLRNDRFNIYSGKHRITL